MTTPRTALVIGAGIAGPVAAMALRKAGIRPTIYEAHPSGAEGIGTFLTIASNGIDALRAIGADQTALAAGFPTPTITLCSTTGKNLGTARTGLTLPDGTTSHTLKRADLYQALYQEAARRGIDVQHGKRLTAAEPTGNGVRAVFDDGTDAAADVLIGTDGIHSTVRKLIDPTAPAPTYIGLINLGGYARGVEVDAEPGSYTMIFGKRAFFGYVLTPSGEVWWFANIPRRDEPARGEAEAITAAQWQARLAALYAADAGPAARLVEASDTAGISKASPIHSIPHLPFWHNGRMIVIGDAAHAPTPTSGQGASLSIEDTIVLAQCLRDLPTPEVAFTRFQALRRPRVERIIKQAARINSSKTATPLTRILRDATLPAIMKMAANSKQATAAYRYHIDWDTPPPPHTTTRPRPTQRTTGHLPVHTSPVVRHELTLPPRQHALIDAGPRRWVRCRRLRQRRTRGAGAPGREQDVLPAPECHPPSPPTRPRHPSPAADRWAVAMIRAPNRQSVRSQGSSGAASSRVQMGGDRREQVARLERAPPHIA